MDVGHWFIQTRRRRNVDGLSHRDMRAGTLGRQSVLVGNVGALETQFRLAQLNDVARMQNVFAYSVVVDEGAADAVKILNDDTCRMELNLAVSARDVQVIEACHGLPTAADHQRNARREWKHPSLVRSGDHFKLSKHETPHPLLPLRGKSEIRNPKSEKNPNLNQIQISNKSQKIREPNQDSETF